MAEENLEEKVASGSGLEQAIDQSINDAKGLGSKLYYAAKGALPTAVPYLLGYPSLALDALITAGGFVAGKLLANWKEKKENTFSELANEAAVGGLLGTALHGFFAGVIKAGSYVSSLYGTIAGMTTKALMGLASIPPFMLSHEVLNRAVIKEYEAVPWNETKEKIKNTAKLLGLPVAALNGFAPQYAMIPGAAAINTAYAYLNSGDKEEPQQLKKAA